MESNVSLSDNGIVIRTTPMISQETFRLFDRLNSISAP
jgi:hypothetical protein